MLVPAASLISHLPHQLLKKHSHHHPPASRPFLPHSLSPLRLLPPTPVLLFCMSTAEVLQRAAAAATAPPITKRLSERLITQRSSNVGFRFRRDLDLAFQFSAVFLVNVLMFVVHLLLRKSLESPIYFQKPVDDDGRFQTSPRLHRVINLSNKFRPAGGALGGTA